MFRYDRLLAVVLAAMSCGVTTLSPTPAVAEPTRTNLVVVEIATDDADEGAKALTLALRDEVRSAPDLKLIDIDISLQVEMLTLKCIGDVPDTACQAKIADRMKADRYIWGTARKGRGSEVIVDLHYWQRGKSEVRHQTTFDGRIAAAARGPLSLVAKESLDRLVHGATLGTARLLAPENVQGEVLVDGVVMGTMSGGIAEVRAAPGAHTFEIRLNGTIVARGKGDLVANAAAAITLRTDAPTTALVPVPSSASSPPPPSSTAPDSPRSSTWQRPVGWGAVAAGGVMLAGSFASMARIHSINTQPDFDAYRRGFGSKQDICDLARSGRPSSIAGAASPSHVRDDCSTASTFEVLEFVLLGLGVASAGAGAYLLLTNPSTPAASSASSASSAGLATTPSLGARVRVLPRTGELHGLDVQVQF